jgi:hypothetical protein
MITESKGELWIVAFSGEDLRFLDNLVQRRGTNRLETLKYILNSFPDCQDILMERDRARPVTPALDNYRISWGSPNP